MIGIYSNALINSTIISIVYSTQQKIEIVQTITPRCQISCGAKNNVV